MSNILDIPQIAVFDPGNLQNDLHIGFGGDIAKRIQKARWTDETHATKVFPAAVDALMNAFVQTAVEALWWLRALVSNIPSLVS